MDFKIKWLLLHRRYEMAECPTTKQHKLMSTRIRLQRHGRKGYAHYTIVTADSRAPRDGRFIERLGYYDPNTDPATIGLNFERALYWLEVGAQPSDTARSILRKEGVLLMKHLRGGVKKGAFDEAAAQQKFEAWKQSKAAKLEEAKAKADAEKRDKAKARRDAERKINQEIAKRVAEKKAAKLAAEAEAAKPEQAAEAAGGDGAAPAAEAEA